MGRFLSLLMLIMAALAIAGCGESSGPSGVSGGGVTPGNGTPGQTFLYVANEEADTVAAFSVAADGTLTPTPNSIATAQGLGLAANGRDRVYSSGDFEIEGFTINNDGSLTRTGNWTRTDPGGRVAPGLLTMAPGGAHLYAQIFGPTEGIQTYTVNRDGSLTATTQYTNLGIGKPEFTGDGQTAYLPVSFHLSSSIAWLARDVSTGALTQIGGFGYPNSVGLGRVAISPAGKFVAHALVNGRLAIFSVDQDTRALSPVSGSPFDFGGTFGGVAWSANEQFLLVASNLGVRVFRITGAGNPNEISGQPGPIGMTNVLTTGTNIVFATSAGSGTVSSYRLDPNNGRLTRVTNSQPSGAGAGEMALVAR